jgi:hypothetical protein
VLRRQWKRWGRRIWVVGWVVGLGLGLYSLFGVLDLGLYSLVLSFDLDLDL